MWEDFFERFDLRSVKLDSKAINVWYYVLPLIPILCGSFLGAEGGDFRFAPFLFLILTAACFRLAFSLWYGNARESETVTVRPNEYFFCPEQKLLDPLARRALLAVALVLTVIFGLLLCITGGFGLLAFLVLALAGSAAVSFGLDTKWAGATVFLVFFCEGFLLTTLAFYAQCGYFSSSALVASLPVGFTAAALQFADEASHRRRDAAWSLKTLGTRVDADNAAKLLLALIVAAYVFVALNFLYGVTGLWPLFLFALIYLLKKQGYRDRHAIFLFYIEFGFAYAFLLLLRFAF